MKNRKAGSSPSPDDDLRRRAEERLKESKSGRKGSAEEKEKDTLALVHELEVHQIELEMQNEELKRAKLEAEDALIKYTDLYDFAPIGLFTLDVQGLIQEVNMVGAALLGIERRYLLNNHFWRFVAPKDQPYFNAFCKSAFETFVKQTCELKLIKVGGSPIYARVEGFVSEDRPVNTRECRIAVMDIT
jgi:PAS domain-containing protein